MKPKLIQELSVGVESYVTVTWKDFSTQSQVSLASIVDLISQSSEFKSRSKRF